MGDTPHANRGPSSVGRPRKRNHQVGLGGLALVLAMLASACEMHGVNPLIGVMRKGDSVGFVIYACRSSSDVRIWTVNPQDETAKPTDPVIWEVAGTAPQGVLEGRIGVAPTDFRTVRPLEEDLFALESLAVYVDFGGVDQATQFRPSDLPNDGILSDGEVTDEAGFLAAAQTRCG